MRQITLASLILASTFLVPTVLAGDDKPSQPSKQASSAPLLTVGSPAPSLTIAEWIKGAPVTSFEKGKVYVVEFWATWCGPCIQQMPHITKLQAEYKDKGVTIIGVSSVDRNGNSLEKVKKMVADKGDATMGYTVAWDKDRTTSDAFMKAAKQNGIPCSFVVDKAGTIAYIGHPMYLDMVLEGVVAGTWNGSEGTAQIKNFEQDVQKVFKTSNAKDKLAAFNALEAKQPKLMANMIQQKYELQLEAGDTAGAQQTAQKLFEHAVATKDAQALNALAWTIVDPDGDVKDKDIAFALKAATEADRLSENQDPAILDTLARVYFVKGDKAKAIEIQTKAVSLAEGGMKAELEKSLEEFKK